MSKLLIQEPPLQVLPSLAVKIGLEEAIAAQQIHYMLNAKYKVVEREGDLWVEMSYTEWQKVFPFWSTQKIGRVFRSLEEQGIVESQQFRVGDWDMRKAYRLNYAAIEALENQEPEPKEKQPESDEPDGTEKTIVQTWTHERSNLNNLNNELNRESFNRDSYGANAPKNTLSKGDKNNAEKPKRKKKDSNTNLSEGWPSEVTDYAVEFMRLFGRGPASKSEKSFWIGEFLKWSRMGARVGDIALAFKRADDDKLSVKSPASIGYALEDLRRKKQKSTAEIVEIDGKKYKIMPDGTRVLIA